MHSVTNIEKLSVEMLSNESTTLLEFIGAMAGSVGLYFGHCNIVFASAL